MSSCEQIVSLTLSKQKSINCDEVFGPYNREELPFQYQDGSTLPNAEVEYNCWFIENPVSKELQKQLIIKLAPKMTQEFIVVIKAPKNKLTCKIASFIDIELQEEGDKLPLEKHVNHKEKRVVLKEQPVSRKIEILLLGFLDNPMIKCVKQLFNKAANQEIISLAVKKTGGIQKFKLPFKNLSSYLDADIEFAFIRTQNPEGKTPGEAKMEPIDCLSFYCQPNQLKISADQSQILTVQIKVNTDLLFDESRVDPKSLKQPCNKLLVARLKNSQVLFSYFVSLNLIDDNGAQML